MTLNRDGTEPKTIKENLDHCRSYFQELLNIRASDQDETVIVAAPEDPLIETTDFSF